VPVREHSILADVRAWFIFFLPPVSPFCQGGERASECRHGSLSCCSRFRPRGAHLSSAVCVYAPAQAAGFPRGASMLASCVLSVGHVFRFSVGCGLLQELISVILLSYRIKKIEVSWSPLLSNGCFSNTYTSCLVKYL
jgi:hypothetical protein